MTNFKIIQKRKIWLTISVLLFVVFGLAWMIWGLKYGIDFTGGSLLEIRFLDNRPDISIIREELDKIGLKDLIIQPAGEKGLIMRFQDTEETKHQEVLASLDKINSVPEENSGKSTSTVSQTELTPGLITIEELRYDSVGPSIGQELKRKSFNAIVFVFTAIVLYITYAFRKVSKPVASWKFGLSALVAMFHDVIITIGVFAVLGRFFNIEIDTPFVAAVLTVVGYSVHDTIVVFDRIRENLPKSDEDFEGTVNNSLNQTLVRSINTTLTVILTLVSIIIFGGASIRTFVLALTIGIFIGTYSSIFVASPLVVIWEKWSRKE